MNRELIEQIVREVINDYVATHGTKSFATSDKKSDIAKEALKKCNQKYQKNVLDKLIDND